MNKIDWKFKARKQMLKLPESDSHRIALAITKLKETWPLATGIKKLVSRDEYRLRVGDFRVIFTVSPDGKVTILTIIQVSKRNERTYKH